MSVKLYYWNCSGHCSLSLSLPPSHPCPLCSNSSVPITQNLLHAKLYAALLEGSLQLLTEVRHIGFCTHTGLYLLPFPATNKVCSTKKRYLIKAVTCLKIQGVTQKFPGLWCGALARYNAAVCCYIVLKWFTVNQWGCCYNRHLSVMVFLKHQSSVKLHTLQAKKLHQVSFTLDRTNTCWDLRNSEKKPPVKTPWIQHKPLNCIHISKVAKMGMRILKVQIAHRHFGLTEVRQVIREDRQHMIMTSAIF